MHTRTFKLRHGRGCTQVEDAGFRVELHEGLPVLADAACVMYLKAASDFIPCGRSNVRASWVPVQEQVHNRTMRICFLAVDFSRQARAGLVLHPHNNAVPYLHDHRGP